ncbi:MAG: exodeoxyribonuclease V subunit gamma [Planctomycetes bacterium]|nr:exodeoxyribonuclease V subunit gamma [Planctomycetota bacterium]
MRKIENDLGGIDRPIWVICPTNLLQQQLQRALAQATDGIMGVRFLTLRDAARRLAYENLIKTRGIPLPNGSAELVIEKSLGKLSNDSYFGSFQEFSGSARTIHRSIGLLRNCLWTPERLARAAELCPENNQHARQRLQELAQLWESFRSFKKDAGFFDQDDLLWYGAHPQQTRDPDEAIPVLHIYGFYDLTPLQARFVSRLIANAQRTTAYLLYSERNGDVPRGFRYATPTVDFFRKLFGSREIDFCAEDSDKCDLSRLRKNLFPDITKNKSPDVDHETPPVFEADGSVRLIHCPGETAEAEEVSRSILRMFKKKQNLTVGILTRDSKETAVEFEEAINRASLSYYMSEGRPLIGGKAGRIVLGLIELANGEATRSQVLELLSIAALDLPAGLHATALDKISRKAGIVQGWETWSDRFKEFQAKQLQKANSEIEEEKKQSLQREAELASVAAEFLDSFLEDVRKLNNISDWDTLSEHLANLTRRCVAPDTEARLEILKSVRELACLNSTDVPADLLKARRALQQNLSQKNRHNARFQHSSVTFTSIMGSRGTIHDIVIVPRMVEKSFPRQIPADAILDDFLRRTMNRLAGKCEAGSLPLREERAKEERYLFRIALGCARRGVILSWPRIESYTGRPRIESRFIGQSCEAILGRSVKSEWIAEGNLGQLVKRVCMEAPGQPEDGLDVWEYDRQVYELADQEEATAYSSAISQHYEQASRMESHRWSPEQFGRWSGALTDGDTLHQVMESHALFHQQISPTRLETYAKCPLRYFLRYVLGAEVLEVPEEETEIPALEWGSLLHDLYCEVYRDHLAGTQLRSLDTAKIEKIVAKASEALDKLGAVYARSHPAAWSAARSRALTQLRRVITYESENNVEALPRRFEFAFQKVNFALDQDGKKTITLYGRVDRIDRLKGGGLQVIDYKTGSKRGYRKNSLEGGTQLQLPLYLLCTLETLQEKEGRAKYFFTRELKFLDEFTAESLTDNIENLRRVVELILAGVRAGEFFPVPHEIFQGKGKCDRYCPFRTVCGPAGAELAEIKWQAGDRQQQKRLRELWQIT